MNEYEQEQIKRMVEAKGYTETEAKQIRKMVDALGCTEAEAKQIIADDDAIDHGANLFALTHEQEMASKKARQATGEKKPTAYKFDKRQKKENPTKQDILKRMADLFEDAEITNKEREFTFVQDGVKYRVTLAVPRTPKS